MPPAGQNGWSENEPFTRCGILESNSAQMNWIVLTGRKAIQCDSLVGNDTDRPIRRAE